MKNNIEIAQAAKLRPITALAQDRLGIPEEALEPFGRYKAKLSLGYIDSLRDRPDGKLVLVTAISPSADVRVIPLAHAKAADAKAYLEGLAAGKLGQSAGFAREPVIEVLDKTNSILVAADGRQHELLAVLVKNLDVPSGNTPPLRILQLRSADAATLANALMQTYGQRSPEEKGAKPVQITAEAQTNALIVAAHPDLLPEIQQIVEDLNGATRQSASDREIRIFSLRIARAAELARTIDEMYPQPPVPVDPRGRARPELQPPREVVVRSLHHHAAAVVLAHNHPGGTVKPSQADMKLTRTLQEALALIDVTVRDHIIVAQGKYLSMAEEGLI